MTIGLGPHGSGKLRLVRPGVLLHFCPACKTGHTIDVHGISQDGKVVGWDGDLKNPTVGELIRQEKDGSVCEYLLRGGMLIFTQACTHHMSGQAVALEEYPL